MGHAPAAHGRKITVISEKEFKVNRSLAERYQGAAFKLFCFAYIGLEQRTKWNIGWEVSETRKVFDHACKVQGMADFYRRTYR